ncbi:hypothetical protein FTUN_3530 [Frigoriglobus tundricola]|uniref:Uncharacterized protein n=1 Tax=Frigoriglobus tundricola TaxID=2774151 RepID=A0A6M5YRJ0_9BACT|nr:hypothetical protein FTUN_3530 [Frigoriglobus tundricola]
MIATCRPQSRASRPCSCSSRPVARKAGLHGRALVPRDLSPAKPGLTAVLLFLATCRPQSRASRPLQVSNVVKTKVVKLFAIQVFDFTTCDLMTFDCRT